MSKIHDKLRRVIERSSKSRYRLSKETGIEESQLSRFMYGKAKLGTANVEKLAEALGYEIVMRKRQKRKKG